MTHLSLFSGIGGIDLAAHWAGFTTVAFCEQNEFCQKVLAKHWPGVPCFDDIRTIDAGSLGRFGRIDLVSGGFPCQPFSVAGKQRGNEDDRFLWPEMLRVIALARPAFVLAENVPGLIAMALDDVLASLESEGYTTRTLVFPACGIGAPHRRERVFIVAANAIHKRRRTAEISERWSIDSTEPGDDGETESLADTQARGIRRGQSSGQPGQPACRSEVVADAKGIGEREQADKANSVSTRRHSRNESLDGGQPCADAKEFTGCKRDGDGETVGRVGASKSRLGRSTHGLPARLDRPWGRSWEEGLPRTAPSGPNRTARLKALGNAVVPQQAYPILQAIATEIQRGRAA